MARMSKKILSVIVLMFFLISLFCICNLYSWGEKENNTVLSYPKLFYLEYVRNINAGTDFEHEAGRLLLQARRQFPQRVNSLRASIPDFGNATLEKASAPRELGVLCAMVFLTVIQYIYRTDGKKRCVN